MSKRTNSTEWRIDRRTVLRGTAAGLGIAGMSGLAAAKPEKAKGKPEDGPCFKDFACEDEEATYVKIEFVKYYDEETEEYVCYFEEETDTGLIEITGWDSKAGEPCEPTAVDWTVADGYRAAKVVAYGGQDCVPASDPDPDKSFETDLENPGGETAAISNLQFCVVPAEQEIIGTINLSYEDLPKDASDWDVNDWVVDLIGTFTASGETSDGFPLVTEFTFDIVPQARGAGDDHEWHMLFESLCGSGTYDLTVWDNTGEELRAENDTFDGSALDLTVFPSTEAIFADLENAELPASFDSCTQPNEWATLTVTFDEPCAIHVPTEPADLGTNGGGLFFDPYLVNLAKPVEVHKGDIRLVTVPDDWAWPLGAVQIWDAYDGVSEATTGYPSYDDPEWYLPENIVAEELVATCDFDPADLDG